jgi:dihydroorotate dehydrogenase
MASAAFLALNRALYGAVRPLIFRRSAQRAHERAVELMRRLDSSDIAVTALKRMHDLAFDVQPVNVGGVNLPYPLMLAAGFVKGDGFADEDAALATAEHSRNIIPGWRSMPALVGPVEFGSFTRWPRMGNPGMVIWRDAATQSTQNRVGLRNPGAHAAAYFLAKHRNQLPPGYGINLAVSPGVDDPAQQQREVLEAINFFLEADVRPAWFTLNLSCPNTEDDPGGRQTKSLTRDLCGAVVEALTPNPSPSGRGASKDSSPPFALRDVEGVGQKPTEGSEAIPYVRLGGEGSIPLWVKVGPDLADEQYAILMRVFAEVGVRGVIATNTLAQPVPGADQLAAGVGGGRLHDCAVAATIRLSQERARYQYPVDVIGCGGVMDRATYRAFKQAGAQAVQYWSALIYRGPLAGALILNEDSHA